jgi:hypothetical protein
MYQLLPWDQHLLPSLVDNDVRKLGFWRCILDRARFAVAFPTPASSWAGQIDTQSFHERTTVILGFHPRCDTASGVYWSGNALMASYRDDMLGDGFMLHACSVLPDTKAYLACGVDHVRLPMAPRVISAVINVLRGNTRVGLPPYRPNEVPCSELISVTPPRKRPAGRRRSKPARRS